MQDVRIRTPPELPNAVGGRTISLGGGRPATQFSKQEVEALHLSSSIQSSEAPQRSFKRQTDDLNVDDLPTAGGGATGKFGKLAFTAGTSIQQLKL